MLQMYIKAFDSTPDSVESVTAIVFKHITQIKICSTSKQL